VVCDVEAPEVDAVDAADAVDAVDAADEVVPLDVVTRSPSSDSPLDSRLDDADDLVLAAAAWVVVALWSCHASTPPSESMAATLSTVAALRAFAARGLRVGRGPGGTFRGRAGSSLGEGVCSSMAANLRMVREGVARTG
jgi:hypothetical protein